MIQPIAINLQALNLPVIVPMAITLVGALTIIILDLLNKKLTKHAYVPLTIIFLLASLSSVLMMTETQKGYFDLLLLDGLSVLTQIVILTASIVFIPLALTSQRFHEFLFAEYFAIFLFMVAGFQFMVSTDNLIFIFIGLETASLALYTLIAMHNRDRAIEAAIKYFTMGALAAGFYAFGVAFIYLSTGSVELHQLSKVAMELTGANANYFMVGLVFLFATLGFKLSIVPFHTWTPDAYEGASAPLAGYMSIVPKLSAFIVAIRIFEPFMTGHSGWVYEILSQLLLIAAVVTMTVSNILALIQDSVKRMLAYSSISHAGFVLTALLVANKEANVALFLYWILFLFTNLGAFTMLWISRHKSRIFHSRFDHPYIKFAGMIQIAPVAAILMAVFMLSLAGVPPFSLFWGKLFIFNTVITAEYYGLAIIMAINSAISVYYYLKLIVFMFFKDPNDNEGTMYDQNATVPFKTIVGISAFITTLSMFGVQHCLDFIRYYLSSFAF